MPDSPSTQLVLESEPEQVPELTISTTTSETELINAHKLIADSIAQQRATLVRSLLYGHPNLTIPPYILLLCWLYSQNNIATALLFAAGCTIAILSACGRFTDGYIGQAEKMGSKVGYETMMGRVVVIARWGEEKEVIGVAAVEMEKKAAGGRGVVWALAVRLKYRQRGVGRGLLEEVVREVRGRFGGDAEVVFADEHASMWPPDVRLWSVIDWDLRTDSFRIESIPKVFNQVFDKHERKVRSMLEDVKKTQTT